MHTNNYLFFCLSAYTSQTMYLLSIYLSIPSRPSYLSDLYIIEAINVNHSYPHVLSSHGCVFWRAVLWQFPAQVSSMCIVSGTIFAIGALQLYSPMIALLTQPGLYWFYGGTSVVATLFSLVAVTETKAQPVGWRTRLQKGGEEEWARRVWWEGGRQRWILIFISYLFFIILFLIYLFFSLTFHSSFVSCQITSGRLINLLTTCIQLSYRIDFHESRVPYTKWQYTFT